MTSNRNLRCFALALAPDASASTRLPCLAYINVPLSTYCKIVKFDTYRNLQGHRAVCSPCDSMAFLFLLLWFITVTDMCPIYKRQYKSLNYMLILLLGKFFNTNCQDDVNDCMTVFNCSACRKSYL